MCFDPLCDLTGSEAEVFGERCVRCGRTEALHADHETSAADEASKRFTSAGFDRHDRRPIVGQDSILRILELFEKESNTRHGDDARSDPVSRQLGGRVDGQAGFCQVTG